MMTDVSMVDLIYMDFFLMDKLGQQYISIESMPFYEADLFIQLKLQKMKEEAEMS